MFKRIKVTKNGPYVVSGKIPLGRENSIADESNVPAKWEKGEKISTENEYYLCRCGKSGDKPFCDGQHIKYGFDGTETAGYEKFDDMAEEQVGPDLILKDNVELCAVARFCEAAGNVWNLTDKSNEPLARKKAIEEACNCPSGRLVACEKNGKEIEPKLSPEISLIEDTPIEMSGPIWVKGKIPIESAEGKEYEIRNRVTLCRCGRSQNKPFCDGTHLDIGFKEKK